MKTIETKISANGNVNIYVDGKRTSNTKAFEIARANNLPTYDASCHTYAGNFVNKSFASPVSAYAWLLSKANNNNSFADGSWEIQQVDKSNGRRTTIYENVECAFTCDNAELEAYILTLDNADAAQIKAQIAKLAKAVKAESLKLDPEWQRQQAAIERERAERKAAEAKKQADWEATKYLAAKIALDSKSVNDNFRFCIYCFEGESVQCALHENRNDDNTDVFDLLPTVDELNDVDTDEVTEAKTKAEFAQVEAEMQDMQTALEIEMCEGNDDNALVIADKIVELNARYGHLYEQIYGHTVEVYTDPESVIAATAGLLKHENTAAELKAKYDASDDEDERVEICIEAYRNYIEPRIKQQTREIAEQVCDSMTAAAPDDWSVAFTENGKFAVYSGDSVNVVDTITAGDFLNPKEFFEQFRRKPTQAELDDPNVAALAELNHEREQLLTVRDELAREYPDEVERLKLLDEMIAETDADITALESFKKPRDAVEFDDKGNVKAVWF